MRLIPLVTSMPAVMLAALSDRHDYCLSHTHTHTPTDREPPLSRETSGPRSPHSLPQKEEASHLASRSGERSGFSGRDVEGRSGEEAREEDEERRRNERDA